MDNRFWGSLGLSSKAGKLIYGVPMIIEAIQKGKKVYLVIEAGDTSDNTHKKLTDKCSFYGVEKMRIDADGVELASRIGELKNKGYNITSTWDCAVNKYNRVSHFKRYRLEA